MKKILSIIFAVCFLLSVGATQAFAAKTIPTVTYDGAKEAFEVTDANGIVGADRVGDLFTNFKDVIPGDSLVQDIVVSVENAKPKNTVKLMMKAENPDDVYTQLMKSMTITVFNGTEEITSKLSEGVLLGTFEKDGTLNVTAKLDIPVEAGNEIQGLTGQIDWVFTAEVIPDPVVPDTGDNSKMMLYGALMLASVLGAIFFIARKKKAKAE